MALGDEANDDAITSKDKAVRWKFEQLDVNNNSVCLYYQLLTILIINCLDQIHIIREGKRASLLIILGQLLLLTALSRFLLRIEFESRTQKLKVLAIGTERVEIIPK